MKTFYAAILTLIAASLLSLPCPAAQNYLNIPVKDPSVNQYVATWRGFYINTGLITQVPTSETAQLYLQNPSTNLYTAKVFFSTFGDITGGHTAIFRIYANPTCTTGTTVTPQSSQISAAGAQTSLLVAKSTPSCSGNGTLLEQFLAGSFYPVNHPYFVKPNNSLLITVSGNTASDQVFAELFEGEE